MYNYNNANNSVPEHFLSYSAHFQGLFSFLNGPFRAFGFLWDIRLFAFIAEEIQTWNIISCSPSSNRLKTNCTKIESTHSFQSESMKLSPISEPALGPSTIFPSLVFKSSSEFPLKFPQNPVTCDLNSSGNLTLTCQSLLSSTSSPKLVVRWTEDSLLEMSKSWETQCGGSTFWLFI